jgi:hypothetical protein
MRSRLTAATAVLLLAGCGAAPAASTAPPASPAPSADSPATGPAASATQTASSGPVSNGAPCRPSVPAYFFGHNALTGVQFVSPLQGWVVGQHVILATADGGTTWTVQRRGDLKLVSLDFISASTGWAVGVDSLLTTTDGGHHWSALPEPCGLIRSVHFVSPRIGYAIANGVRVAPAVGTVVPDGGASVEFTADGGKSWQPVQAPADPQSVCFSDRQHGWLGAHGNLYETSDGGHTWRKRASGDGKPPYFGTMVVQCASGPAWAEENGPGAASNQQPHAGYYASPGVAAKPLFAELYFVPSASKLPESAGAYSAAISAISASSAAFIDNCAPCGYGGTSPWLIASADGSLSRRGDVADINFASAASFVTSSQGWVLGLYGIGSAAQYRVVHTSDGGHSWQVQYRTG